MGGRNKVCCNVCSSLCSTSSRKPWRVALSDTLILYHVAGPGGVVFWWNQGEILDMGGRERKNQFHGGLVQKAYWGFSDWT